MSYDEQLDTENVYLVRALDTAIDWDVDESGPCVLIERSTGVTRLSLEQAASLSTALSLALTCAVEEAAAQIQQGWES